MVILEGIVIIIFGLAAVFGALVMVLQRDPIRAALGLLLTMASIGAIFLAIGAHFLGFVQIIVYAGAIVILFLFAIMHFPVGKLRRDRIPATRIVGGVLILVLAVTFLVNLAIVARAGGAALLFAPRNFNDALEIGQRFTSDWIYPFELISVLLLVAVIASVHLTRARTSNNRDKGGES